MYSHENAIKQLIEHDKQCKNGTAHEWCKKEGEHSICSPRIIKLEKDGTPCPVCDIPMVNGTCESCDKLAESL